MDKFSDINTSLLLSETLKTIISNKDFLRHLNTYEYASKTDEEMRTRLINGRCDSVCRWISERFNDLDFYLLYNGSDEYHIFMKKGNMFYDGYNYEGVPDIKMLKYVQTHNNQTYGTNDIYHISTGTYDRDKIKEIVKWKVNDKN